MVFLKEMSFFNCGSAAYLFIEYTMEQENEQSLRGIKHGKQITEEQRFFVEGHQAKHPSETKDWEDYYSCFHASSHFSNAVLCFDSVSVHHSTQDHDKHDSVGLRR